MKKWMSAIGRSVSEHRAVVVVFLAGLVCRWVLVARGGQLFWVDEHRFYRGMAAFSHLSRGDVGESLRALLFQDHVLIGPVSLLGVPFQMAVSLLRGTGIGWDALEANLWVVTTVLSLFAAAVPVLVYALGLRIGMTKPAALTGGVLTVASVSLTAYSRHLLSYDLALFLGLLALVVGLARAPRPRRWVLAGVLGACAYMTYNGYYMLALLVAALPFWRRAAGVDRDVSWAAFLWIAAGAAATAAAVNGLALAVKGSAYLAAMVEFSRSIVQGAFHEGWSVPWAYFWGFEKGMLLVWAIGVVAALWCAWKRSAAARTALLLAAATYVAIIVFSVVLHRFVVYGRTARVLVPFLCLSAAVGLDALVRRLPVTAGWGRGALYGGMAILFVLNLAPIVTMSFPESFEARVAADYGPFDRDSTLLSADDPADDAPGGTAPYIVLNTRPPTHPLGVKRNMGLDARDPLQVAPHPFAFAPFVYEFATPAERAVFRQDPLCMCVYRREAPDPKP